MTEAALTLDIVALDARGDGLAADGLTVAGALPGERVRAAPAGKRAELIDVVAPSPERAEPFCPHYGVCGGCAAQHMSQSLYAAWKRDTVVAALSREGVALAVGPLADAHGEGRRRATFHARFPHHAPDEVGFMRARSHAIVAIDACPLFAPALRAAPDVARAVAAALRGLAKPLDIAVAATLDGLDVDVRGAGPLDRAATRKLIEAAEAFDLARLSNHGAAVIERRAPRVAFGAALVALPPGGFLQATQACERRLAERAESAFGGAKRVADLFCGAGAFALRLATSRDVTAYDSDAAAIAALKRAAGATPGLRALSAETRDLFHRPLRADELARFDAVLFDPPRAGAEAQARCLAASAAPLVVAVSCNAASFARDARILIEGGYVAQTATPLDQFRFSPHVEIVAAFRRPRAPRRARRLLG